MDIQNLFKLGMKRDIAQLIEPDHRRAVNLGAGNSPIPGVESLDWPNWDGASGRVPYEDGELTAVYAFHFFEHLTGTQVIDLVKDLQRAMAVGATLNVVVPFYNSNIAHQDLDHKRSSLKRHGGPCSEIRSTTRTGKTLGSSSSEPTSSSASPSGTWQSCRS